MFAGHLPRRRPHGRINPGLCANIPSAVTQHRENRASVGQRKSCGRHASHARGVSIFGVFGSYEKITLLGDQLSQDCPHLPDRFRLVGLPMIGTETPAARSSNNRAVLAIRSCIRIDVFRATGSSLKRASQVDLPAGKFNVVALIWASTSSSCIIVRPGRSPG